jgi:hypothetical protein
MAKHSHHTVTATATVNQSTPVPDKEAATASVAVTKHDSTNEGLKVPLVPGTFFSNSAGTSPRGAIRQVNE